MLVSPRPAAHWPAAASGLEPRVAAGSAGTGRRGRRRRHGQFQ